MNDNSSPEYTPTDYHDKTSPEYTQTDYYAPAPAPAPALSLEEELEHAFSKWNEEMADLASIFGKLLLIVTSYCYLLLLLVK